MQHLGHRGMPHPAHDALSALGDNEVGEADFDWAADRVRARMFHLRTMLRHRGDDEDRDRPPGEASVSLTVASPIPT